MRTVSHREMRNQSGEILRAVAAGETVQVTNNGQVAAMITPPPTDSLTELERRGQLRRARRPLSDLAGIKRKKTTTSTAQILAHSRGRW